MSQIAHQPLGDLQPFRMADVQRDAALAGVLVVELAAHVGVGDAGQRRGRRIARRPSAHRRHRGQARVGIVLPFDLDALGAQRGEEARAAGGRQEPGEVEDAHALQRERLVVRRRNASGSRRRAAAPARSDGAPPRASTASVSSPSSGARRPTCQLVLRAEPFAGRIAEAAAMLRMVDFGEAAARRANARRAHSHAACAAAPRAGRHPAPPATACRHRSRRG